MNPRKHKKALEWYLVALLKGFSGVKMVPGTGVEPVHPMDNRF